MTAEPMTAEPMTAEPMTAEPMTAEPMTAEPMNAEQLDLARRLATQLRVDSIRCSTRGRVRASHLVAVRGRPDGRVAAPASAL